MSLSENSHESSLQGADPVVTREPKREPVSESLAPKQPPEQQPKRELSKKSKVVLLILGWFALLGAAAGLALLFKPAPKIVYTNPIIDAYKFSEPEAARIETVDDLDYYGTYTPNPLTFIDAGGHYYQGYKLISGLKDKAVEAKINQRIEETAQTILNSIEEDNYLRTEIGANYYNILSLQLRPGLTLDSNVRPIYLTFDLRTGEELSLDDLFSDGINLTQLFYKSFYDTLSASLQFDKMFAERVLRTETYFPHPASCQYCPQPGQSYDDVRAQVKEYNRQLADIEQIALEATEAYLSGERRFYLRSYGPVLVLPDGREVDVMLKDNIRYAVYLKNYRTVEPIFEQASDSELNPFFTENPSTYVKYMNEETDGYLFDYVESNLDGDSVTIQLQRALRNHLKSKALAAPGEAGKFRHIMAEADAVRMSDRGFYMAYATIYVEDLDKAYYDAVYRRAIIDGKLQNVSISLQQPAQTGHYDVNMITNVEIPDFANSHSEQTHFVITKSGEVLDNAEEIFVDPVDGPGWQDYFKAEAYGYACAHFAECYSDEEKQSHEFIYEIVSSGIQIWLKTDTEWGRDSLYQLDFNTIPERYFNPNVLTE